MLSVNSSSVQKEKLGLKQIINKEAYYEMLENDLLPYLQEKQFKSPSCFISYAWGDPEHERWVQEFAELLEKAKIKIFLDRWADRKGNEIGSFALEKIPKSDFVLVMGTSLYKQKYEAEKEEEHILKAEMRLIRGRLLESSSKSNTVIPVLLEGTMKGSFPAELEGLKKIPCDFIKNDPFEELLVLIRDLYRIDNRDPLFQSFQRKRNNSVKVISKMASEGTQVKTNENLERPGTFIQLPPENRWFIERPEYVSIMGEQLSKTKLCVLYGLGGMGKTQLANKYLLDARKSKKYAHVVKISAEYYEIACNNLVFLGKELFKKKFSGTIDEQAKKVLQYISEELKENLLLLYDNVNSYEELCKLMPSTENGRVHILATSRNSTNWPRDSSVKVQSMLAAEGVALIKKIVGRTLDGNEESKALKLLVKEDLQCHPLALAQAGAYINNCAVSISGKGGYRELFKSTAKDLIGYERLPFELQHSPALVTFDLNFNVLKKESPKAIKLLDICAYCHADNIPFWFMEEILNVQGVEFNKVKEDLNQYSLMNFYPDSQTASIHRILQAVRKIKNTDEGECHTPLNQLTEWLNNQYDYYYTDFKFKLKCDFLTHALSIIHYIESEKTENRLQSVGLGKKTYYIVGLIYLDYLYNPEKSKTYLKKAVDLIDESAKNDLDGKIYRQYAKCLSRINPDDKEIQSYFSKAVQFDSSLNASVEIDKMNCKWDAIVKSKADMSSKITQLNELANGLELKMKRDDNQLRVKQAYINVISSLFNLLCIKIDCLEADVQKMESEISTLYFWQTKKKASKEEQKNKFEENIKQYEAMMNHHSKNIKEIDGSNTLGLNLSLKSDFNIYHGLSRILYKQKKCKEAIEKIEPFIDNIKGLPLSDDAKLGVILFYSKLLVETGDKEKAIAILNKAENSFEKQEHKDKITKQITEYKPQSSILSFFKRKVEPGASMTMQPIRPKDVVLPQGSNLKVYTQAKTTHDNKHNRFHSLVVMPVHSEDKGINENTMNLEESSANELEEVEPKNNLSVQKKLGSSRGPHLSLKRKNNDAEVTPTSGFNERPILNAKNKQNVLFSYSSDPINATNPKEPSRKRSCKSRS